MVTMRALFVQMGTQAQLLMISLESGLMSWALTILLARPRRMIPYGRIFLKLTLWRRILGVTRTACLLMLATRVSMHGLCLTMLCQMVPLHVVSMSAIIKGLSTGIRLRPLALISPFLRSVLYTET